MTFLFDVNIWIASAFEAHQHHDAVVQWCAEHPNDSFAFCRTSQQGFLRIATNPRAGLGVGQSALTLPQAWNVYDQLLQHPRIVFHDEAVHIETNWRAYTDGATYSRHIWTDAYLAAFAQAAGFHLVTLDGGFGRYSDLEFTRLIG